MLKLQRKWSGLMVALVALVMLGAAACEGCAAKVGHAIDLHAPVVVDEAGIIKRYVAECKDGNQDSCDKASTHADLVAAAGAALMKAKGQ